MPFECIKVSKANDELEKMGIVDVKNFGAMGDGVTDDATAIQEAVSSSANKILYFPQGVYLINSNLTIDSNVKVVMLDGAKIKPTFTKSLNISGAFECGLHTAFDEFSGLYDHQSAVDDGLFDRIGRWTVGSGWSISGGRANHSSGYTSGLSYPDCAGVAGKTFIVKYTIGGTMGSGIYAKIGNVSGPVRTAAGTYYEYITANDNSSLTFFPTSSFAGWIDNVEVYMLGSCVLSNGAVEHVLPQWFGAIGDGITDSTLALMRTVYSAPDSSVVRFTKQSGAYIINRAIKIDKQLTIEGNGAEIIVSQAKNGAFNIASGGVTVNGLVITGYQKDIQAVDEVGIKIYGVDNGAGVPPTFIKNVIIKDCEISNFGYGGIVADYVKKLKLIGNNVHDINYAAIMTRCIEDSEISSNICKNIFKLGYVVGDNAYGIIVTTWNNADTIRYPRPKHVFVTNNIIENVPSYEGLDTHGGDGIVFSNNIVINCYRAVALTTSTAFSPINCIVSTNKIYTTASSNMTENGIDVYGISSSNPALNNVISNNVVVGHGSYNDIGKGCIRIEKSMNTSVTGNVLQKGCNQAIAIRPYNYNFTITGNSIIDAWSDNRTDPTCIRVLGNNVGVIEGNTFRKHDERVCYSAITFIGSGLNNMTVGGYKTSGTQRQFLVEVDGTGTPNTFKWSKDDGNSWDGTSVAMTGSAQTLTEGVTITFGSTTGHTLGDRWSFSGYSAMQFGILATSDATIEIAASNNIGNVNTLISQGTYNPIRAKIDKHYEMALNSIPSSGTFTAGDRIFKLTPSSAGSFIGWVCTSAGSPGTWYPFGAMISVYNGGSKSGTWNLDITLGTVITCTAVGDITINASGSPSAGEYRTFIIANDATPRTITFGTGFRANSTLVGTASKAAVIKFVFDGTSWFEVSRVLSL